MIPSGWLNPFVEAGEGINVSFTIERQPKDKILSKISQATMINQGVPAGFPLNVRVHAQQGERG